MFTKCVNACLAVAFAAVTAVTNCTPAFAAQGDGVPRYLETPPGAKPRVVVTADPELDDANSLVRFLLYSTDYRVEGLIYASSQFHWAGDGKGTAWSVPGREYERYGLKLCPCTSWRWAPGERFIDEAVDNYARAYPNLRVHRRDFPTPEALRSTIRWGNVQFDGEIAADTPGSNLIKALLLDDEEAPVYLHAWGGQSTIARALKSIEEEYGASPRWAEIRAKVIRKAVIHPSGDQDDTYASYIKPHWPEIRYRQLVGGVPLGYLVHSAVSDEDAAYFTAEWTSRNVLDRGPLGASYRVWGDGKQMVKGDRFDYFGVAGKSADQLKQAGYIVWVPPRAKGEFLAEGDTGTFLNLIDNGLLGYRGDSFGGWGGNAYHGPVKGFAEILDMLERAASGTGMPQPAQRAPTHPFLAAAQRDFAARLQWATTSDFAKANHNPQITLASPQAMRAKPGQRLSVHATTADVDGNAVSLKWWRLDDPDGYRGPVHIESKGNDASIRVPGDARPGDRIQIIAEATDDGTPALTRYAKVVVTVVQ